MEEFFVGFKPSEGGHFVSEGDPGCLPAFLRAKQQPEDKRLARIDRTSRFQRIPDVTITTAPPPDEPSRPGVPIVRRPEDGTEKTLADLKIPQQALAVLSWLAEREAAFGAKEPAAAFPDIPFERLKKLLQSCAKGGLLRLLRFPAIDRVEAES